MKLVPEKPKQGKLVAIVGPTASGKSALAMQLAQKYNGEIICADSRTIYKGFDIGTAKPSLEDQQLVPHHLLDICEPGEEFNAAEFKRRADSAINDIWAQGKVAFLVGGSGMYIDAVLFGYTFRSELDSQEEDYINLSLTELQQIVRDRYPKEYECIDKQNPLRLKQILRRGLADKTDRTNLVYDCQILGVSVDRLLLKQRIELRIDDMLNNGFIQEVKDLINTYGESCPQLKIIGYKYAVAYLAGEITLDQLKEGFAHDDGALAKRQMTWFRRNPYIQWVQEAAEAEQRAVNYLAK